MRLSLLTVYALLAMVGTTVTAWSKEDQEIFRLRDEVELSEGSGTTFYDFLGIKASASQDDINRAYRKKSRTLHPDKVKTQFVADKTPKDKGKGKGKGKGKASPSASHIKSAAKEASDRFARLGIVTEILRGAGRERYDHFLSHGFPKWKGTGYYYARFRPGLTSVLIGLFIFVGGGGHYLVLLTSWKRDQEFIQRQIKYGRRMAWGDAGIPGLDTLGLGTATSPIDVDESDVQLQQQIPRNRRERRMADKMEAKDTKKDVKKSKVAKVAKTSPAGTPPSGAAGPRKRVMAQNGRILVVDTVGNVYMEQKDDDGEVHEFLLNPADFPRPTIRSTALYRIPSWFLSSVQSRVAHLTTSSDQSICHKEQEKGSGSSDEMEEEGAIEGSDEEFEVIKKDRAKTSAVNGKGSKKGGKKGRR